MAVTEQTPDQLKEYEERFINEAWNDGNFDVIDETISEDYVGHWFQLDGGDVDREGLKAFIRESREGFSDLHMEAEFMLAEDDMVAVGFTVSGTHDGEFAGIPATGNTGSAPGIFVHQFDEDGKVIEAWATWDALGQMQQLGVLPRSFTLAAFLETGANLAKQDVLKLTKKQ